MLTKILSFFDLSFRYLHISNVNIKIMIGLVSRQKIGYFAKNVRTAYDTLVSFCKKHNNDPKYKHKITLYTYTTVPTMSAVIIDEQSDNGELVLEHFGYHSGQNRPLFLVKKVEQNSLFDCIKEQINMEIVDKLVSQYKNSIRFSAGAEPYITLKLKSDSSKTILDEVKKFLKEL